MSRSSFSPRKQKNLAHGSHVRRKRLWNRPLWLRKAAEASHVPGGSLRGGSERSSCGTVKVKSGFCWRPQYTRDARAMRCLLGYGIGTRPAQPRSWKELDSEEPLTLDREMQSLESALMILGLGLVQYFLTRLSFLPFGTVMCHCMLEVCAFLFISYRGLQLRVCHESQKRL